MQLNDRLIIRDKRYLINEMKTNLVTGETTFQLLNDFMPVLPARIINTEPNVPRVGVPIIFPHLAPNTGNTIRASFTSTNPEIILPDPITREERVIFNLPPTRGADDPNAVISISVIFEGSNGSEQTQEIIIIRQ